jgi:hypothetical protein
VSECTSFIRLCASIQEEHAIFDKVAWDIEDLFDLVGHVDVVFLAKKLDALAILKVLVAIEMRSSLSPTPDGVSNYVSSHKGNLLPE